MATEASVSLFGVNRIISKMKRLEDNITSKTMMGEIGQYICFAIKKRTMEGVDADGVPFLPYSPSYALFRASTGRSTRKVNLFYSGSMLSAMTYKTTANQVRSYFLNTKDENGIRNPEKAFHIQKRRRFFALSERDITQITNIVEEHYRGIINNVR